MAKITISVGASRTDTKWDQVSTDWGEFTDMLQHDSEEYISPETHAEYLAMPKAQQDRLKDVGGFVGGCLRDGRRKHGCCTERQLITLDMDNCAAGSTQGWIDTLHALGFTFAVYSTRKHDAEHPRLRVILPTDRPMAPDEYQPTARGIARIIDPSMAVFDRTTFELERLMYWPSSSCDSERVMQYTASGNELSVDDVLASCYSDWHSVAEWPVCPGEREATQPGARQMDPREKPGIVGAFCRTYDIPAALEHFIPGTYLPCSNNRLTYAFGTTTSGAVIYDDGRFLYSHHSTDPAGGRLVNAWDLIRLHKFGAEDDAAEPGTPTNRLPSFTAMCRLAEADGPVSEVLHTERLAAAQAALDGFEDAQQPDSGPVDWHSKLSYNKQGSLLSTIQNMAVILDNDPQLKGRVWIDRFANRQICRGPFPWPGADGERGWGDNDDAGLRWYFETTYHISGVNKIFDATNIIAERHARDPVCEYLRSLTWDGVPRLDSLFIEYLGAEDNRYTRAVNRKAVVAAVARAFVPGYKFDQVVILSGPQGIGKSTILRKLGRKWFSDSINSFNGKDAREAIQGVWIIELGELNALDKAESEAAKQFISQTEDWFRPAYGRRTMQYPRRCVFFGTSNHEEFLRDTTGNRRYWPVDVGRNPRTLSVFEDLPPETVDQIWAEAVQRYREQEPLYLDDELAVEAGIVQEDHREEDPWTGIIQNFVEQPVPRGWNDWTEDQRYSWWQHTYVDAGQVETEPRDRVCVIEIWCELMGQDRSRIDSRAQRRIGAVLSSLDGWQKYKNTRRFGPYGAQKAWLRVTTEGDNH